MQLPLPQNSGDVSNDHILVRRLTKLSVFILLIIVLGLAYILLNQEIAIPIGPMYWDTHIYNDAANRINNGQIPHIDFDVPVGPFTYWLIAQALNFFPNGQPLLAAQWSLMIITVPLLCIMAVDIANRSAIWCFAIVLPFIIFAISPLGGVDFYPFPGVEGVGVYNRHGAQLMYLVSVAVFLVRNKNIQLTVLTVCALVMFLSKVTAFIGAGLIVFFGLLSGFIAPLVILISGVIFFVVLAVLEITMGITSAYFNAMIELSSSNSGTILPRFLTVFSQRLDVILATSCLIGVLFITSFLKRQTTTTQDVIVQSRFATLLRRIINQDFIAVSCVLFAGIFFETQNTGSQAFICLWPLLLLILTHSHTTKRFGNMMIFVLCLAAVLPTLTKITHKTLRTTMVGLTYDKLPSKNLKNIGLVTAKDVFINRVAPMTTFYQNNQAALTSIAQQSITPDHIIYSQPDFQLLWLQQVDRAIDDILAYEAENNIQFATIFSLDFTNPYPYLLDRNAPKGVSIAGDPYRTLGKFNETFSDAISKTDLILQPRCPILPAQLEIEKIYKPFFVQSHEKISLSECMDAHIKKRPAA